jgi:putative transposase
MHDRHRDIALFRYSLIRAAADDALSKGDRGRLVRYLAAQDHAGPHGDRVRVSRKTLDRWIRAYRAGGFDALTPVGRTAEPRTPASVLEMALALKRERPARTAAQIGRVIATAEGWAPSERTIQRLFIRHGLGGRGDGRPVEVFGRFEADQANELWTGDALHGLPIGGHKAYLLAFIDDHSRLLTGYRWCHSEDTVRMEAALRSGLTARGLPAAVYVDNGSAFVSKQLLRACASLRIKLTHSTPRRPQGRGKIERFFRTVRDQFLVEVDPSRIDGLIEFNRLFSAWVESVYHQRVHSETGQTPLARFDPPQLRYPTPAELHEAFLWSEQRTVTKTATVSLFGNHYEVDAALAGRRVELVFDPFDLTAIDVRYDGRPMGPAIPHHIGRHSHPAARPAAVPEPVIPTGIDYLRLVETRHTEQRGDRIQFGQLRLPDELVFQPLPLDDNPPEAATEEVN